MVNSPLAKKVGIFQLLAMLLVKGVTSFDGIVK
jgi:hypothetical protein